jgi:hypothetical protein
LVFFFLDNRFINPNNTNHNTTTAGGMTDIAKAQACTGFMSECRNTQSADNESPIADALATAYI